MAQPTAYRPEGGLSDKNQPLEKGQAGGRISATGATGAGSYADGRMEWEKFDVFLKTERMPVLIEISKIVAEFRGILVYEATQMSRHSWGFVGENLSEEEADRLLGICAAHDMDAGKVKISRVPAPKNPVTINSLDFKNGRLNYKNASVESFEPLSDLIVTAYASIKHTTSKMVKTKEGPSAGEKAVRLGIMMTTGLPIGMGKNKEVTKELKSTDITLYVDLIFLNGLRLKFNSEHFDYSCLGEKKTYSSQMNITLLCQELAKNTPGALRNTGMYDILEKKITPTLGYDSLEDLDKEIRRLLLLKSPAGL